jgi:hypothetical protein
MTTQAQSVSFTLDQSGKPFVYQNGLLNSGTLNLVYSCLGGGSAVVTVEGFYNPLGNDINLEPGPLAVALDSITITSNTTRAIALNGIPYAWFQVTANLTGGTNPSVGVTATSTGAGATYSSSSASVVQVVNQEPGPG